MARLTGELSDPDIRAASIPQRGVQDNSEAGLISSLGGLLEGGLSGGASGRRERELLQQNETLAGLQTDILDTDTNRRELAPGS